MRCFHVLCCPRLGPTGRAPPAAVPDSLPPPLEGAAGDGPGCPGCWLHSSTVPSSSAAYADVSLCWSQYPAVLTSFVGWLCQYAPSALSLGSVLHPSRIAPTGMLLSLNQLLLQSKETLICMLQYASVAGYAPSLAAAKALKASGHLGEDVPGGLSPFLRWRTAALLEALLTCEWSCERSEEGLSMQHVARCQNFPSCTDRQVTLPTWHGCMLQMCRQDWRPTRQCF